MQVLFYFSVAVLKLRLFFILFSFSLSFCIESIRQKLKANPVLLQVGHQKFSTALYVLESFFRFILPILFTHSFESPASTDIYTSAALYIYILYFTVKTLHQCACKPTILNVILNLASTKTGLKQNVLTGSTEQSVF